MEKKFIETKRPEPVSDLRGFLTMCGLFGLSIVSAGTLWFGAIFFPRTIGLYVTLPYYFYILLFSRPEVHDGVRWEWFSRHFPAFRTIRRFFRLQLVVHESLKAAEAKEGAQFIFAVFPHGSNCDFRIVMDGELPEIMPNVHYNIRALAATVLFRIPFVRELALWTGCVDASRPVAEKLLKRGRSLLVLPGGQAEQIRTVYGQENIFLQSRKGFVKLAMKHGVPLVPVYAFGASDYYHTSNAMHDFRFWLVKTLGISIPLAWGKYGSLICPLPVETTIVFGRPLNFVMKNPGSPTPEELDVAHGEFCRTINKLFDEHKTYLGYGDRSLTIQ